MCVFNIKHNIKDMFLTEKNPEMNFMTMAFLIASVASAYPAQSPTDMNEMSDQERTNRLTRRHFVFH